MPVQPHSSSPSSPACWRARCVPALFRWESGSQQPRAEPRPRNAVAVFSLPSPSSPGIVLNLTILGALAGRLGALLTESFGRYWALGMATVSFVAARHRPPALSSDLEDSASGHSLRRTRSRRQRGGEDSADAQDDPGTANARLPRRTIPGPIEQPGMIGGDVRPWSSMRPHERGGLLNADQHFGHGRFSS